MTFSFYELKASNNWTNCSFGFDEKRPGDEISPGHTVKSQIFVRYLISYFRTFEKKKD